MPAIKEIPAIRNNRKSVADTETWPSKSGAETSDAAATADMGMLNKAHSTDAPNSGLIVNNEVSATPCRAISACAAANEKAKKGFPSHRDWFTRERT